MWGKIFLGDGGGYFLGAFLACFPLDILVRTQPDQVILIPAFFGIYLFDTGVTLIHRLWQGKNLMEAHKQHLYQKLQQTGWSHTAVSGLYAGFAFYQGALVYFSPDPLVIYPLLIFSYSLYGLWVTRRFQFCVENHR
jgi:Fuc2NAc and GlcNAc transferase